MEFIKLQEVMDNNYPFLSEETKETTVGSKMLEFYLDFFFFFFWNFLPDATVESLTPF